MAHRFLLVAQRAAQPHVGRLQRTEDAGRAGLLGSFEDRQSRQVQFRVHARGTGHLHQMAEQAETGQVGAGGCAVFAQAMRGVAIRLAHDVERGIDPGTARLQPRMRGEQCPGADRLGEDQRVARPHAALAHH